MKQTRWWTLSIGCNNEDDCLSLSEGRWGRVLGVRVTHVAAGVWALMLLTAAGLVSGIAGDWRPMLWNLLAASVLVASLAGGWFILLQAIVLRRWCRRCNLAHAGAFAALVTVIFLAPGDVPWLQLGTVAVALIGVFIALQVFFPPAQFTVAATPDATDAAVSEESVTDAQASGAPIVEATPTVQPHTLIDATDAHLQSAPQPAISARRSSPASTPRTVRLAGGRVALRTDSWPMLGDPSTPHVIALMMDYLCKDCCQVHRLLLDAVARSAGSLAVLILPVPMDPQTHPSLRPPKPPYDNPRAYARLAMAMHHLSPDAFLAWDRQLVHADPMPMIDRATAFAHTLVAPEALTQVMANPLIDATLRESAMWFTTAGPMQVPKLLLPQSIITGRIPDVSTLLQIIEKGRSPAPPLHAVSPVTSARPISQPRGVSRSPNIWSNQRIQ